MCIIYVDHLCLSCTCTDIVMTMIYIELNRKELNGIDVLALLVLLLCVGLLLLPLLLVAVLFNVWVTQQTNDFGHVGSLLFTIRFFVRRNWRHYFTKGFSVCREFGNSFLYISVYFKVTVENFAMKFPHLDHICGSYMWNIYMWIMYVDHKFESHSHIVRVKVRVRVTYILLEGENVHCGIHAEESTNRTRDSPGLSNRHMCTIRRDTYMCTRDWGGKKKTQT